MMGRFAKRLCREPWRQGMRDALAKVARRPANRGRPETRDWVRMNNDRDGCRVYYRIVGVN